MSHHEYTTRFQCPGSEESRACRIIARISSALTKKGYDPVSQLVGYLLSGDPTYITKKDNARALVRTIRRDELLEEFVRGYVAKLHKERDS